MAARDSKAVRAAVIGALLLLVTCACGISWSQSVSMARWKNNATGAYSLNHDDYGATYWGDYAFVDSILYNRGLSVSFSVIAGDLTRTDSLRAAAFGRHGYRFINHSMSHGCDTIPLGAQLAYEYDSSQAVIERKIPSQGPCLYWVTPCGDENNATIQHLRDGRYIGCRNDMTGPAFNDYRVADPFNIGEPCYQPNAYNTYQYSLTGYVQQAINGGTWAVRQAHCVSDDTSLGWCPITHAIYRAHMDWCKAEVDSGHLWMAPVQTVLMYALERSRWSVAVTSSDASTMQIAFDNDSVINPHVTNQLFTVPLTLLAVLPPGWVAANAQAVQRGHVLPATVVSTTTIRYDADPWGGTVTVNRAQVVGVQRLAPARNTPAKVAATEYAEYYTLKGANVIGQPSMLKAGTMLVKREVVNGNVKSAMIRVN